jgi:hypothetical protein
VNFIPVRERKLLDMDLVKIVFCLMPFRCTWLAQQQELVPESHQLRLQYETPRRTVICAVMDAMISEAGPTPDDTEIDLADCEYAGDSIMEDLLKNIPKLQGMTNQTLIFIRGLLFQFLREDLLQADAITDEAPHPSEIEDSIRSRVESLISLFFCSHSSVDIFPATDHSPLPPTPRPTFRL